ncbi:5-deoxy-glucuronate isomerase [Calidifontibacter sp. DB0510]|uniref:5-deoxy-glucuronate isomerase n=1 Tax=Metallococcus carri TaxID=1656884 RepID=A0A967B023_9MICO|nr:5-deoxy-glucuronate isomerase [Metallococcus carri]NHN54928.1 5-deoxy-glucuronate isomerase [Metallococcus carri]NOP37274.1 5-deoxy-glucuronate isomerase [Calidifontibacter sp. DB2511S]
MSDKWIRRYAESGDTAFEVAIRPDGEHWQHTGLLVTTLAEDESRTIETGDFEYAVLPLAGGGDLGVQSGAQSTQLAGRRNVFAGPADCAYAPRRSTLTVTAQGPATVAWCFALATADLPFSVVRAARVPVELRGAGQCSREVHNFGTPDTLEASSLIACEVITPAGNWSSYPPHKHDEDRPGEESQLEEIYYFEVRPTDGAPPEADPVGYCCVTGADERPLEVLAEVRSGDVILVPHGWHGPAMAPPGYDLYYLNVMAGPSRERVWLIRDHPAHGWVRDIWEGQPMDPRLPMTSPSQRRRELR